MKQVFSYTVNVTVQKSSIRRFRKPNSACLFKYEIKWVKFTNIVEY